MKQLLKAYRIINLLSIDVAVGAIAGAVFFAEVFDVNVMPQGFVALGLTVWCIYTADHLLDARSIKHPASTARHRLHQEKFKLLLLALVVALVVDVSLALMIRPQVLLAGLILGGVSGVYLLLSRRLIVFKELIAAILYTSGVLLPVWAIYSGDVLTYQVSLVAEFAGLVLINIILFAFLSYDEDVEDLQPSVVKTLGLKVTGWILAVMFTVVFVLVAMNVATEHWMQQTIIFLMTVFLLLIFLFRDYFKKNDRFRLLGDAVFLFPLLTAIS